MFLESYLTINSTSKNFSKNFGHLVSILRLKTGNPFFKNGILKLLPAFLYFNQLSLLQLKLK